MNNCFYLVDGIKAGDLSWSRSSAHALWRCGSAGKWAGSSKGEAVAVTGHLCWELSPWEMSAYTAFPIQTDMHVCISIKIFLAPQYCMYWVLSSYIILAKEMKAWSVAVNLGLVSKCQTHCCQQVLVWEMTKSREKSLDRDQDWHLGLMI